MNKLTAVAAVSLILLSSLVIVSLTNKAFALFEKQPRTLSIYDGLIDVPKNRATVLTFSIPDDALDVRLRGSYQGFGGNQIVTLDLKGGCTRTNDIDSCSTALIHEEKAKGNIDIELDGGKTYIIRFSNPGAVLGLVGDNKTVELTLNAFYNQLVEVPDQPSGSGGNSGCLIATAAFGSELTPQVQFLRGFRDNHILATSSGANFMTAFNPWYYSFSPAVADYERQQPWLQQTVKVAIYPLLGILHISEKAYSFIPGEYGSITAGLVASSMIGAVYVSPLAASIRQIRKSKINFKIVITIIAAISASVIVSLFVNNAVALMITTSLLVLSTLSITAIFTARTIFSLVSKAYKKEDN